jgi:hypothetical protein
VAQRNHRSAVSADYTKLGHVNTYGELPKFYIDRPFTCRKCGKIEIWKARDQKWYYEVAKGHTDAIAVECHDCRKTNRVPGKRLLTDKKPKQPWWEKGELPPGYYLLKSGKHSSD